MTELQRQNSIIALPLDFTSFDTETTGFDTTYDHIIELAAVRYRDGQAAEAWSSLIKPPESIPEVITLLTGISNEMVADAPSIAEALPAFVRFIGEDILIGHNIGFDINFINHAGYEITNRFVNTLRLSHKVNRELTQHRLIDIADHYKLSPPGYHRSLADAATTAAVYLIMRDKVLSAMTEQEFADSFQRDPAAKTDYRAFISSMGDVVSIADTPITGKTVVFTGALERMERKDALLLVARLGGIPAADVTKSTNILVVGNKDFASSVKDGKTGKMKKAEGYMAKGLDIMTISEDTFFEMIE